MSDKLLTEHLLEFLSLKEGCRGSSESTLVKMSNCWKSHAAAQNLIQVFFVWLLSSLMFPSCASVTACYNTCLQIDGVSKLLTFFFNSKLKHRLLVLTGGNCCGFKDT